MFVRPNLAGHATTRPTAAVESAVESLLIAMLNDKEERQGQSGSWMGYSLTDPRVCDMAAVALAVRFKERYVFHERESIRARDAQCIAMQNIWRSANGLQPLDVPKVELPGPNQVMVTIDPPDAPISDSLAKTIVDLSGKRLRAESLKAVIETFRDSPPPKITGMELSVDRDSNETGFIITFHFTPGDEVTGQTEWTTNERVQVGDQVVYHSFGSALLGVGSHPASFKEFNEAIANSLANPMGGSVEIRMALKRK